MADQIIYREFSPHETLGPFIDAYWTVTGDNSGYLPDKVLPDACVDIIFNFGPGFASEIGATQMDRFFADRLDNPSRETLTLIKTVHQAKGRLTVSELAKRSFVTTRQLERLFSLHLDIGPKEFINVTRYRYALDEIRRATSRKTLLDIACECGYYDHAHLANAIKKYTGSFPSDHTVP